jgi:hypothetical protein
MDANHTVVRWGQVLLSGYVALYVHEPGTENYRIISSLYRRTPTR